MNKSDHDSEPVNKNQKSATKSHATDEKQPTSPNITLSQYRKNKQALINFEQTNHQYITLIPCSGNKNWYELAEHSALIYYSAICAPLRVQTKIHFDTESIYSQYVIGYMRSIGFEKVRERIQEANLFQQEIHKGDAVLFKLNKQFSEQTIKEYYNQLSLQREIINKVLPTNHLNPDLLNTAATLARGLHNDCSKYLPRIISRNNGDRIVNLIDQIIQQYYQITLIAKKDNSKVLTKLADMRKATYSLIIEIQTLSITGALDYRICAKHATNLFKLRSIIEQFITDIQKEIQGEKNHASQA